MTHRWPFLLALLALLEPQGADGFCPKGFGGDMFFPPEWKIPMWPTDMTIEFASTLRTVKLGGFLQQNLNEEYLEGPGKEFQMQKRETYWQSSGQYFLYYCARFDKWRIAEISAFGKNMEGNCFAFVSDAHPARDIQNKSLIKSWIEVEAGQWVLREDAGVIQLGSLGDMLQGSDEEGEEEEEVEEEVVEGQCSNETGDDDNDTSKCPVMPTVRRVKKKVVKFAKAATHWARRLFPKMLGEPDPEDKMPDQMDEEEKKSEETCDVEDPDACSFRAKFYIEKMKKASADKRIKELARLRGMLDVQMKPDDKAWLRTRARVLRQMVEKDEDGADEKAEL